MINQNGNALSVNDLESLRVQGLLTQNETAIVEGDLIVAINVITQQRRVLQVEGLMLECKRTLLRD
jgi:hypothetical protein